MNSLLDDILCPSVELLVLDAIQVAAKPLIFPAREPRVVWSLLTLECERYWGKQQASPCLRLFDKSEVSNQHYFVANKIKSDNIPTVKFSARHSQVYTLTFGFVFSWFIPRNTKDLSHQILTNKLKIQVEYYWYTQMNQVYPISFILQTNQRICFPREWQSLQSTESDFSNLFCGSWLLGSCEGIEWRQRGEGRWLLWVHFAKHGSCETH